MSIVLNVDKSVYPLPVVEAAAYRFIDRLTILIFQNESQVVCEIKCMTGRTESLDALVDDFKRELLDQKLRCQIKQETEPVRNLILALAFSKSGLQE
jgi:His-Xaa-Ser system protein HxsD